MLRKKFNKPQEKRLRINMQIRVPQVQLIDEEGKQLGTMDISKAIHMAYDKGLDLVEIVPNPPPGKPPIAKIMDFGKFMYQKEKKDKGGKKSPAQEMKTLRIGIHTSEHDLSTKAKQIDKFIKKGHPIKIDVFLRGREKMLRNEAKEKLKLFPNFISEPHAIDGDIKPGPSGFSMFLKPAKSAKSK